MRVREGLHAHRRARTAAGLTAACILAGLPAGALAGTQSLQVSAAPNPQATRPEAITATGSVSVASAVTIFAQAGGSGCAGTAGLEAARGAALVDQRTVNGSFSYSVAFTPTTAGTYYICTYVDGSANGITQHQNQAFAISVAAAPPAPAPAPAPTPVPPAPAPVVKKCVVPALKRHTEGGARHLLLLANCKLGRVYRPSARAVRIARRRAGGRTPTPIVVSQTPVAGTVANAGGVVAIRLGFATPRRPAAKTH